MTGPVNTAIDPLKRYFLALESGETPVLVDSSVLPLDAKQSSRLAGSPGRQGKFDDENDIETLTKSQRNDRRNPESFIQSLIQLDKNIIPQPRDFLPNPTEKSSNHDHITENPSPQQPHDTPPTKQ